ncbi:MULTISPECIES: thiamine diphosphokinase [unclassified Aureimonas]|uniref:thiamine diphosphokinase n=1 Tax=unclassified Aureimonas TaxID=2615206 RepID=UPI0007017555|nr:MULTISPECIES: thiamine diphosphokinase [unclassified Aureimonas]KQT69914.1 thiamine pyrophosphokinase [Aureimonas sp. Leaf427]KQT75932.1 thiamine pyrophosphokinase [Aureimonas sp. Leaf460]
MSRFTVLLAGTIRPTPALRDEVAGTRVVAADRGMRHAAPLGLSPELWIGDFDSAGADLQALHPDVPRETFPADKDKTDGELAIRTALARGATSLLLVGACGGPRTDHAFMHLVLAIGLAEEGVSIELFDGAERGVPLVEGRRTIVDAVPGAAFSILRFSDVEGLSISGAKWPLEGVDLPFSSILTQSNEATGPVEVTIERGRAVLIVQAEAGPD